MNIGANTSFTALLSSLSLDSLTRGKQFERLSQWWLTQDPIRSLDVKQVWLWDEWPGYSGRDIGIDLVAELFDGSLCAIQAKCFDENRDIPKSELDSFISAASQHTFQHRWLIATTDRLSANARRMLDDQHVVRILRSDLEASLDSWPASIDDLNPIPQPKSTPRPHQHLAVKDVVNGLKEHDRGQLIMACGTGKTLTALWIKETLQPKTTLVLVPSLNLLAQTLAEWAKNMSSPWNYLCVCSDDTVNKADDQPISTVGDLPFDVTTDSKQIASFLQLGGEKIIFSTYQSSAQVAKAQEGLGTSFDLVICDEAHRLTGKTDADYATVLDEKKIVAEKRLFMTATPRTYTTAAKTKAEDRGVEITSMDDEHIYGPVLHKLSFGEAVKQELLSDYRVLIVGVTDPQVQDLIDRRELVSVNDAVTTDARTLAAHIGLAKATKDYNLKRTISFHSRIKTADQFARDHAKILEWLPESHKPSGETWTGTISGAMNTGDRRKLLTQLRLDEKDRHAILTNARCLTEGVDVPSLDGVAFIDPRSSQVDIIQAVGRAIRKSENKEVGTIVLPVLIPTDSDVEHVLEDSAFKPIWSILNALKSHDEELAIELNSLRTNLGRTGKIGLLPERLVEDLPIDIDFLIPGFTQKLSISIIENSTATWDSLLGELYAKIESEGKDALRQLGRDGYKTRLGAWVSQQRLFFNKGSLAQDRIKKLEEIDIWTWSPIDDSWETWFKLLEEYVKKHGTSRVPHQYVDEAGNKLGHWVQVQRRPRNRRTNGHAREIRLAALPKWSWDPFEDIWNEGFLATYTFGHRTGTTRSPRGHKENGVDISAWMTRQRRDHSDGKLSREKAELIESLPDWSWDPLTDDWHFCLEKLREYMIQNPENPWPSNDLRLSNGVLLASWVSNQRSRHKLQKLSQERVSLLEGLPVWHWSNKRFASSWNESFNQLKTIASLVSNFSDEDLKSLSTDKQLIEWVNTQRRNYRSGRLNQQRVTQLESIPGWKWNVSSDDPFQKGISELQSYLDEHGNADVPHPFISSSGFRLGAWVSQKRVKRNKGLLPQDQAARLEEFEGWSWSKFEQSWFDWYEVAKKFSIQNGHCSFPRHSDGNVDVRTWASNQRKAYRNGKLTQERIHLLELLNGWSWTPKGGPPKRS